VRTEVSGDNRTAFEPRAPQSNQGAAWRHPYGSSSGGLKPTGRFGRAEGFSIAEAAIHSSEAVFSVTRTIDQAPLIPMTKTELHELVDALPDESLPVAAILLRRAQDPAAAKLDAALR
jgi:hypothetical protein